MAILTSREVILSSVLLIPLLAPWYGTLARLMYLISKQTLDQRVQEAKKDAEKVTFIAEKNLKSEIANLSVSNFPL